MSSIDELQKLLDEILKWGISVTTYYERDFGNYVCKLRDETNSPIYQCSFSVSRQELQQVRDPHYVVYLHLRKAYKQIADARKARL